MFSLANPGGFKLNLEGEHSPEPYLKHKTKGTKLYSKENSGKKEQVLQENPGDAGSKPKKSSIKGIKCLYINAQSMGNKQTGTSTSMKSYHGRKYDIVNISEIIGVELMITI